MSWILRAEGENPQGAEVKRRLPGPPQAESLPDVDPHRIDDRAGGRNGVAVYFTGHFL
jgi:hypothetical protein